MRIESIAVSHHGRTVHGIFRVPEGDGPFPAVLLSHGYNGCMTDFDTTAECLAEGGIASLSCTFCGGSTRDTSGFPTTQMTLFTEREDAMALLDWLKAHPQVDDRQVFLFGGSMGGLVSVLAAAERPGDVAGLALMFPALGIADNWRERFPKMEDIPETVDFWNLTLGRAFFASMRELDVFSMLPSLGLPTVIFQGDQDPVVPLASSQRAAELFPNARLHVFPGEGHGFSPEVGRQADALLRDFVKACVHESSIKKPVIDFS